MTSTFVLHDVQVEENKPVSFGRGGSIETFTLNFNSKEYGMRTIRKELTNFVIWQSPKIASVSPTGVVYGHD